MCHYLLSFWIREMCFGCLLDGEWPRWVNCYGKNGVFGGDVKGRERG